MTIKEQELPVEKYFADYLMAVGPEIFWAWVEAFGDYQGNVYGVGLYKGKYLTYSDYYGSCGGCGAWGEGGEPTSLEEILKYSRLYDTEAEALAATKGDKWHVAIKKVTAHLAVSNIPKQEQSE